MILREDWAARQARLTAEIEEIACCALRLADGGHRITEAVHRDANDGVYWRADLETLTSLGRALREALPRSARLAVVRDRDYSLRADGREVAQVLRGESITPRYNVCWLFWIGERWWAIPNEETRLTPRSGE